MLYLVTHYWIWLAAAFVIGAATPLLAEKLGWAADLEDYWLSRIGVAIAIILVLIVAKVASGKTGLMLEAAGGLIIAYIIGGVAGGISSSLLPGRFEGWWVGLFATGLVWAVFGIATMPKFEPDLRERVAEVVKTAGADPLNFDVAGRDVLLPADIATGPARAELSERIQKLPGVRLVSDVDDLTGSALAAKTVARLQAEADKAKADSGTKDAAEKEAAAKAAAEAAAKEAAAKEAAAKAEAEAKEAVARFAAETAAKEAAAKQAAELAAKQAADKAAAESAAKPAAQPTPTPESAPIKTAAAAAATAPVAPAVACQSRVSALVAAEKINFERGSAEIDKASAPLLSKLAAAIAQCPAVTIEVAGHTDGAGKKAANEALSKRRAEAVVDSLTKAGIGAAKLVGVGYGSAKPIAGNDSAEGRAQNRRIEFVVK